MNFTIDRDSIIKPLQTVTGVVERRQTMPILANVLLSVKNNRLSLTGTDLEVEMQSHTALVNAEDGEITIPARKFLDICRALPDQAEIKLSLKDNRAVIRSGKSRFILSTLSASEFPNIETVNPNLTFSIPQKVLKDALERTSFAMAQQDVRYYLNGMLFEINDGKLILVATDGHRLALCDTDQSIEFNDIQQVIVPRKGVLELMKLLADDESPVEVQLGNNFIRLQSDSLTFTSKLIDGRFPDYQNVVPQNSNKTALCDRDALRQALARVSILSNEKYRGVRLQFMDGKLHIQAHNPEQEEAEEEIAIQFRGDELEIGFNVSYIMDAVTACTAEQVQLSLADPNSCCLIEGLGDDNYRYVIMPMRL